MTLSERTISRVFLGGSRKISRLNDGIRARLEEIAGRGMQVLVGDANGADRAMQRQLAEWGYPHVTVYFVGSAPRNNEGGWPTHHVPTPRGAKGFDFFSAKDRAMADAANCGMMLWDGESRGTLSNVENLVRAGKPVSVYVGPRRRFTSVCSQADLEALVAGLEPATASAGRVQEFADGRILLEARELRAPDTLSTLTLAHMDEAVRGMSAGEVGDEFELCEVEDLLNED